MVLISALLIAFSISALIWYFGNSIMERSTLQERFSRVFSARSGSSAAGKQDLMKGEAPSQKKLGLFDFVEPPNLKEWLIFSTFAMGSSYFILFRVEVPGLTRFLILGVLLLIMLVFLKKIALNRRTSQIRKELPGTLDLIVICLEAGLGMTSAFLRVANETENSILGKELRLTFNQVSAGIPLDLALKNFARRTLLPEVNAIVVSVIQAQKMGTAVAKTFRVQAESLREQYKMKTKEEIMKIPIKILFPLVFFIFPALFIVILGPAMIAIIRQFSGMNE